MVHLLASERPTMAAAPSTLWSAVAKFFARLRARRAMRVAYQSLLEYDPARLDDLGIDRQDLFEALDSPSQRPGLRLNQRRAESARLWLDT